MIMTRELPRVLFVDDEVNLLRGLFRQVRGYVLADLATTPAEAIERLKQSAVDTGDGYAAIVSDMRMPDIDGAELLRQARTICPDTTRILLTGYADVDSAMAAVNDGSVFRFLTKPCPAAGLRSALTDAVELHQLVRDRKNLLERTLRGAVGALVATLAMADPGAFARASRLGRLCAGVTGVLGLMDAWKVEMAAQLGEIGAIALPPEALGALTVGRSDDPIIREMLDQLPMLADQVLGRIPRLDDVREIVRTQEPVDAPPDTWRTRPTLAATVVQMVREYDALSNRGHSPEAVMSMLRARHPHHDDIAEALRSITMAFDTAATQEIDITLLRPGQVLAADLRTRTGTLLVGHGNALTEEMIARIRNFAKIPGLANQPLVMDQRALSSP